MYSNTHHFDLNNFQPLFVYIKKCRMFEDELVSLDPRFLVAKDHENFTVTRDASYCDLTKETGVDLMVLCGRNGAGKSTLLQILSNSNFGGNADFLLVWKDHQDNLASSKSVTVSFCGSAMALNRQTYIDSIAALCANGVTDITANTLTGGIVQAYSSNPRLFDEENSPLFDGFFLDYGPDFFEDSHRLGQHYATHLRSESAISEVPQIIKRHPTLHVLAEIAQDSSFMDLFRPILADQTEPVSFEKIALSLIDEKSRALDDEILRLLYEDGTNPSGLKVSNKENKRRLFSITDFADTRKAIRRLSKEVDDWIADKFKEHELYINRGTLDDIFTFHPFKHREDGTRSGLGELSTGERIRLRLRFLLTPYLFQDRTGWFYMDDADCMLHPEWSRRFVHDLLAVYSMTAEHVNKVKKRPKPWNRRLTCILVTHSPFILSDLMPQNILLLKVDGNKTRVARGDSPTFAGNIGEMFHTEFFMNTTIGEFARQNIQQAIKTLERGSTSDEREQIRRLFSMVGDEVLKNLLLDKLDHAKNRS